MADRPRRRAHASASLAAAAATMAALLPLTRAFDPTWLAGAVLGVLAVAGVGLLVRLARAPRGVAPLAQLVCAAVTAVVALPGPLTGASEVVAAAVDQIVYGIIPVPTQPPLAFLLVAAAAVLALLVDALAVGLRAPLAAAPILFAVFAAPQIVVPRGSDLLLAVPLAIAVLAMLHAVRRDARARRPRGVRGRVAAILAGGLAITTAFAAAPQLPTAPTADGGLFPSPTRVDTSLSLGDDLRSASGTEVIRVLTDDASAPYLRLATLTSFEGDAWQPDEFAPAPDETFAPLTGLASGVERAARSTVVDVVALDDDRLPVPFAAIRGSGMSDGWRMDPIGRTIAVGEGSSRGERYTVDSIAPDPTYEQAASAEPLWAEAGIDAWARGEVDLPAGVPDEAIATADLPDAALRIPGRLGLDAEQPYTALLELQRWLRSSEFSYSLDTPVSGDFDGTSADAIEAFLEVREGYCVHFAATFAVAARGMGIPTRIVVGYLPGAATGETEDGLRVHSVDSAQLHAWPESYISGLGWVPFDPTPSIASAQGEVVPDRTAAPSDEPTDEPDQTEEPAETERPQDEPTEDAGDAPGADDDPTVDITGALRGLGIAALALLALASPWLVRATIRTRRLAQARGGDATAAWRELRAIAIDAGVDVLVSDSPRAIGDALAARGADGEAVGAVVTAIEHDAFAPGGAALADRAAPLRRIAATTSRGGGLTGARRAALPRSLWRRPRLVDLAPEG